MNKKQTIEMVTKQINVNYIDKQSGTNVWTIVSKNASPEITAVELKEMGFKIIAVNLKNSVIIAEL